VSSTVLLSGACGAGKSSVLTLGYRAHEACWGPTAVIDTDTLLQLIDPCWELAYERRRVDLALEQCGLLAESLLASGLERVLIGGNALHTPEEINPLVEHLLRLGDVFHVTLDPSLDEIVRRIDGRGGDKTAAWLAGHVDWMRARYGAWTCRIDNTHLSPVGTLREIAARVAAGEGLLTGPIR
jgi:hypothetical protein